MEHDPTPPDDARQPVGRQPETGQPRTEAPAPASAHDEARDAERVEQRARLMPGERRAGSDDPEAQAEMILQESGERTDVPSSDDEAILERRSSDRATHI